MAPVSVVEPMNATSNHSKLRVTITLAHPTAVAGSYVAGKMEIECKTDKLGMGAIVVELLAHEELTSRDHSARMTFLHNYRLFQGPNLPPSNAVQAYPSPGDPPLPENYYKARRGHSTFLFRIPLPSTCPASINFASGLARVRYEVRGSVGVFWKGEKQSVTDKEELEVIEAYEEDFAPTEPEAVVVGENGKFWVHGRIVGGTVVAGESACVELQVKNHSNRKNTGLIVSLNRTLVLPNASDSKPLELSDTITTVPFRGSDYILPPGGEGVANLVFDVPPTARSVHGGTLQGGESEARTSEALFEVRAWVEVKVTMGFASKDIVLSIPATIVHPDALPEFPFSQPVVPLSPSCALYPQYTSAPLQALHTSHPHSGPRPTTTPGTSQYHQPHTVLPLQTPYVDQQNRVWFPSSPVLQTPFQYQIPFVAMDMVRGGADPGQAHLFHNQPLAHLAQPPSIARPSSAGPSAQSQPLVSGLPIPPLQQPRLLPLDVSPARLEREEGKGDRASRIAQHLRMSSRHRSVSPTAHRFPLPENNYLTPNTTSQGPVATQLSVDSNPSPTNSLNAILHSPRPQLTHKQSFTVDPLTMNSVSRSEKVVELEKMAAEVENQTKDLSRDIPKLSAVNDVKRLESTEDVPQSERHSTADPHIFDGQQQYSAVPSVPPLSFANMNKTLPIPPPEADNVKRTVSQERAVSFNSLFNKASLADHVKQPDIDFSLVPSDQTPPTPTLVAFKRPPRTEGGLDALERKLQAEVGTRKVEQSRRPDVRSVLPLTGVTPIDIPGAGTGGGSGSERLDDSAISSLTLPDCGRPEFGEVIRVEERGKDRDGTRDQDSADGRTHKAPKSRRSVVGDDEHQAMTRGRLDKAMDETQSKRKRDKPRVNEKLKKSAQGRVAAWLGEIDPDIPPQEEIIPPSPSVVASLLDEEKSKPDTTSQASAPNGARDEEQIPARDSPSTSPNPRSSGFVPIDTFKRNIIPRQSTRREMTVLEEARKVAQLWAEPSHPNAPMASITLKDEPTLLFPSEIQSTESNLRLSPSSTSAGLDFKSRKFEPNGNEGAVPGVFVSTSRPKVPKGIAESSAQGVKIIVNSNNPGKHISPRPAPALDVNGRKSSPRLPVFLSPSRQDPEVRYDVRSARGGRGGIVTAVGSLWESVVAEASKLPQHPPSDKQKGVQSKPALSVPPARPRPARADQGVTNNSNKRPPSSPTSKELNPKVNAQVLSKSRASEPQIMDFIPGRRPLPAIKSTSVPALLSSSVATPTISSTASLARPVTSMSNAKHSGDIETAENRTNAKFEITTSSVTLNNNAISLSKGGRELADSARMGSRAINTQIDTDAARDNGNRYPHPKEMAFGQARLRDLIRKYQGNV